MSKKNISQPEELRSDCKNSLMDASKDKASKSVESQPRQIHQNPRLVCPQPGKIEGIQNSLRTPIPRVVTVQPKPTSESVLQGTRGEQRYKHKLIKFINDLGAKMMLRKPD